MVQREKQDKGSSQSLKAVLGVRDLVFSSSCTVYGDPGRLPVTEDSPRSATNPYGRSKLMIEEILEDVARAEIGWRIAATSFTSSAAPVQSHSGEI